MRSVFITPEVTPPPRHGPRGKARVQFEAEVDRTELHAEPHLCRNGQRIDNRAQLRIIDDSVRYALSNPDVEIASSACAVMLRRRNLHISTNEFLSTNRSRAHLPNTSARNITCRPTGALYSSVAENWGEFRQIVDTAKIY